MRETGINIKYLAYCRKSTEDKTRQIASIQDQSNVLNKVVRDHGLTVVDDTLQESKTAKKPGRPVFNRMLERIERGEANGILCWDFDRLSRNPIDEGQIRWLLQNGVIQEIRTPYRTFYPEDAGLLVSIEGGRANDYVIRLARNVKRGLARKLDDGWRPGPAPLGYINVGEAGTKSIVPDPERFQITRKMWDLFLAGNYSVSQIRDIATEKWGLRTRMTERMGGKPLSMSHMYKIFNESFYYGWYQWKNPETSKRELYKGEHKPMITEKEYNLAQLLLGRKGKAQPKTRHFPFTGAMTCGECGSGITAEEKNQIICTRCRCKFAYGNNTKCPKCSITAESMTKPVRLKYVYYHCTKKKNRHCSQRSIRVEELEKQFKTKLEGLKIDNDYLKLALDYLQKKQGEESKDEATIRYSLQHAYDSCQARLYNLNREYTSPHNAGYALYTPADFKMQKDELLRERAAIEVEMKTVKETIDHTLELSERTFNYCVYAIRHFAYGDLQRKKEIFATIGSNLTLRDGKLNVEALEPYLLIEKEVSSIRGRRDGLEPGKGGFNKGKEAAFAASIPSWLRVVEAVRTWIMANSATFRVPDLAPAARRGVEGLD